MSDITRWINTSVEDMRCSLDCAFENHTLDLIDVQHAMIIAANNGEISRTMVLRRFANKLLKANPSPNLSPAAQKRGASK